MSEPKRPHPLEAPAAPSPASASPGNAPASHETPRLSLGNTPPYLTQAALFLMIALFAVRALSPELNEELRAAGWNLPQAVLREGEIYRLFSSIFLHAGIWAERLRGGYALAPIGALHLLFNAYMLFHFGGALERILGHARFALLFTIGGLSGSVLSALTGDPCVPSLGASGAVFALIGAQVILLLRNRRLFGQRGAAMLRQLLLWTLLNFGIGLASTLPGSTLRIDNWAHFGGLAAGLALSFALIPRFQVQLRQNDGELQLQAQPTPLPRINAALPIALIIALIVAFISRALTLTTTYCPF